MRNGGWHRGVFKNMSRGDWKVREADDEDWAEYGSAWSDRTFSRRPFLVQYLLCDSLT